MWWGITYVVRRTVTQNNHQFYTSSLGLDPVSRKSLLKLIKNQVDEMHCGVILTTHHMDEAEKLCEELSIIS